MEFQIGNRALALVKGDITTIPVDAIGNAANRQLAGGGGVDGAIHAAGGPEIMRELDAIRQKIGHCETGDAVVTGAGKLPARWVIHAVGPIYRGGVHGEPAQLCSCYARCVELAGERGARTLTLPAISTGVYGYPIEEASDIALRTVAEGLESGAESLEKVSFALFGAVAFDTFASTARRLFGN